MSGFYLVRTLRYRLLFRFEIYIQIFLTELEILINYDRFNKMQLY